MAWHGMVIVDETLGYIRLHDYGLSPVRRNYRCRVQASDLTILDSDRPAFVEMRYRKSVSFEDLVNTFSRAKQNRNRNCTSYFLIYHHDHQVWLCRPDVVSLTNPLEDALIKWINGSFQA